MAQRHLRTLSRKISIDTKGMNSPMSSAPTTPTTPGRPMTIGPSSSRAQSRLSQSPNTRDSALSSSPSTRTTPVQRRYDNTSNIMTYRPLDEKRHTIGVPPSSSPSKLKESVNREDVDETFEMQMQTVNANTAVRPSSGRRAPTVDVINEIDDEEEE